METEILTFRVNPAQDKVLGVFGGIVHIKAETYTDDGGIETIVVKTPKQEYLKMWSNWLDGKQSVCETYGEYCGVLGEFEVEEGEELEQTITLIDWEDDGTEDGRYIETRPRVFLVNKFDERPDFEHG